MRTAEIFMHGRKAGLLIEIGENKQYRFSYFNAYDGPPISVRMPIGEGTFTYDRFPPFFEGLLPEGVNLEHLLKVRKIDRNDLFAQLMAIGEDTVGAVTVHAVTEEPVS